MNYMLMENIVRISSWIPVGIGLLWIFIITRNNSNRRKELWVAIPFAVTMVAQAIMQTFVL
jgi:hypothetical protein